MSQRSRWAILAAAAVLLIAGIVAVLALGGGEESPADRVADVLSPAKDSSDSTKTASDDEGSVSGVSGAKTETAASTTASRRARSVKDTPAVPPAVVPTAPSDAAAEARLRYLAETKQVVETNAASLASVSAQILKALSAGDASALGSHLAPDEAPQASYLAFLADRYPTITISTPASTVNVFSVGQATVYFCYAVVRWEDAGIVSEHTISIPMRFINGQWYLTSLDDSTGGLLFVQTVQL